MSHGRAAIAMLVAAALAGCAAPEPPKVAAAPAPKCEEPPKQLMLRELAAGTGEPVPARSAVLVSYTGWLYDPCKPDHKGQMFDTSEGRETPFGFIIGAGRVIKGWDEGVAGMREGGKRELVIPPDKAYGAAGAAGGKIPPNATLVFDVEMVKVIMRAPPAAPAAK
jgi:FKBP-type peptidyl-prolyl cis-trans isomerase FkpA